MSLDPATKQAIVPPMDPIITTSILLTLVPHSSPLIPQPTPPNLPIDDKAAHLKLALTSVTSALANGLQQGATTTFPWAMDLLPPIPSPIPSAPAPTGPLVLHIPSARPTPGQAPTYPPPPQHIDDVFMDALTLEDALPPTSPGGLV
ncbi:hypothetical protein BGW80DRAFT_1464197 [Lactifluus volemus]|nr:hypothetical protein BGW80DRAFT_1464197 [Lactifluus volemus]